MGGTTKQKQEKFDFEKMRLAATHQDPAVRKRIFIDYFERFEEFPSYLFDNNVKIDERLSRTIQDLLSDPETPTKMRKGIEVLKSRLPI